MDESRLAERIAGALRYGEAARILVRNAADPEAFADQLEYHLAGMRIMIFHGASPDPVRETLRNYFSGSGSRDPSAGFDAGWRSHLTELSLMSSGGMESAAGLSSLEAPFRDYILGGVDGRESSQAVLSSFAAVLPTVFIFVDPTQDLILPEGNFPPVVFISGDGFATRSDLLLDMNLMELRSSDRFLTSLRERLGVSSNDLYGGVSEVFIQYGALARFIKAAAVFRSRFHPVEVSEVSGEGNWQEHLELARAAGFLRGYNVCSFASDAVLEAVSKSISPDELKSLQIRAAEAVLRFRGRNPAALSVAGSLFAGAGDQRRAAELFMEAGRKESFQFRRAGFYRTASLLSPTHREECLFHAALSSYRAGKPAEALSLLLPEVLDAVPDAKILSVFCGSGSEGIPSIVSSIPDLHPDLLRARTLHDQGDCRRAEKVLLSLASSEPAAAVHALTELGEQLHRRTLHSQAVCVMRAALSLQEAGEFPWLESRARFTMIKAWNRAGSFSDVQAGSERLMELVLLGGDTTRLVNLLNIMGNTLLLQGKKQEAAGVYSSALRLMERHKLPGIAPVLNNLSVAQRKLERMYDALKTLMKLVRVSVSDGHLAAAAVAYGNMARLFIDMSRFDSAADCLGSMVEFSHVSGREMEESICYISAQLAFEQGQTEESLSLLDRAAEISRTGGSLRRLSTNLLKKGSLLLRAGRFSEAAPVLQEAVVESQAAKTRLNCFIAVMKLAASQSVSGVSDPVSLLTIRFSEGLDNAHRGELYYWHWRCTGSRQSMTAAAQLLSKGLANGLHHHSYLYMLHEIASELPPALAASLPLVHNYPSP